MEKLDLNHYVNVEMFWSRGKRIIIVFKVIYMLLKIYMKFFNA